MFAAENGLKSDPRLKAISDAIRVVPNFPKPGIMFQDITTLVSNHKDMDILLLLAELFIGVESRGFIFAPPIALAIGAKFIPLRKPGKLPAIFIKPLNTLAKDLPEYVSHKDSYEKLTTYQCACHLSKPPTRRFFRRKYNFKKEKN
ncbi:hypothetical protein ACJIZ3_019727 [Penstemon smallii]|uniref:adenine phosphoribosyltransferase n=1 Tax=Penstemon smallii TaxID=265156 RepID=A0ABD3T2H8_9LAMI